MDLEGKIRRPRPEFDNERVRYEHRFAPLAQVSTPPLVPYVQFKEMTKLELNTVDDSKGTQASTLYAAACRHFHQAATILSALTGHSNDENVLITAKPHYPHYLSKSPGVGLFLGFFLFFFKNEPFFFSPHTTRSYRNSSWKCLRILKEPWTLFKNH